MVRVERAGEESKIMEGRETGMHNKTFGIMETSLGTTAPRHTF